MKKDQRLFQEGSVLFVLQAASLILMLFGCYFAFFGTPFRSSVPFTWDGILSSLLYTPGGWLLLGGIALFLVSGTALWRINGLRQVKIPQPAEERSS